MFKIFVINTNFVELAIINDLSQNYIIIEELGIPRNEKSIVLV